MSNFIEAAGYALIVAFLYAVWPPLALLGAGLLLVAYANVRAARAQGRTGRTTAALSAAFAAARHAWTEQTATGLRRVA